MAKQKQVKTVEQAVAEVVAEATPKIQNFHITLNLQARHEAIKSMQARGLEIRENFDGPIFKDIAGYRIGESWVAVSLKDGTSYVYPSENIVRLKDFYTDKE